MPTATEPIGKSPSADNQGTKKPDDVALSKNAMDFINRSLAITGRTKKQDDKATPPKATDDDDSGDDDELDNVKPSPEPKKKPIPQPAVSPPREIDEEKLGEAIGRSVVKAKAMEQQKPAAAPEPDLPAEVKEELEIYQHLEKHFPEKYKGFPKKFLANNAKFKAYADQWERDHPGQEFDEKSTEHEDFRTPLEAETEYSAKDAATALAKETFVEERKAFREEIEKEIAPLKERVKMADAEQDIAKAKSETANQFWKEMEDEFPGVINENGFNDSVLRQAHEKDPDATRMASTAANHAAYYAREIHLLDHQLSPYLGEEIITEKTPPETAAKIQAHRFLSRRAQIEEEAELARGRLDKSGRPFVTRAKYNTLSPEEQAKVWRITTKGLRNLLARHIADEVRLKMQESSSGDAKNGADSGAASSPRVQSKPVAKPRVEQSDQDEKPLSPTSPITPRVASSRGKTVSGTVSPLEAFVTGGSIRR